MLNHLTPQQSPDSVRHCPPYTDEEAEAHGDLMCLASGRNDSGI